MENPPQTGSHSNVPPANPRNVTAVVLAVTLAVVITACVAYGLHRIVLQSALPLASSDAPAAETPDPQDVPAPAGTKSLGDAIRLLPEARYAQDGRAINENLYYVHLQKPNPDEAQLTPVDEAWLVDVKSGKAELFVSRPLGFPYGASVYYGETTRDADGGKFSARWSAGWEGSSEIIEDIFDIRTGAHLVTTRLTDGMLAVVSSKTKGIEHRIVLAPENGCANKTDGATIEATGLLVDGRLRAFPTPLRVACIRNDFAGETYYPQFDYLVVDTYAPNGGVVRLGFPGPLTNGFAEIPLATLDPDKITFPNWR